MTDPEKIVCRTPTGGTPTAIPSWKYAAVRAAILELVGAAGSDGFPFKELPAAVAEHLSPEQRQQLGSTAWHTTTVKLEMEVAGELVRVAGKGPQRLRLAGS